MMVSSPDIGGASGGEGMGNFGGINQGLLSANKSAAALIRSLPALKWPLIIITRIITMIIIIIIIIMLAEATLEPNEPPNHS